MMNIIVFLTIAGILSLAIGKIISDKRKGKACSGCSGCPIESQCTPEDKATNI